MKRSNRIEIIIFLYSGLFLYTAISKLLDYDILKDQLLENPLLAPGSALIATTLPWIEFVVVLMLLIPRWRLKGLYASLLLMIVFTIYIVAILIFNKELPCSCGGILQQLSWPQHLIVNGVFILLAICGIILQRKVKNEAKRSWTAEEYQFLIPNPKNDI